MEVTQELASFGSVALAGLLGGLIGLEREVASKPAGLRTHIFVASGSALLVLLGEGALDFFQREDPGTVIRTDPIRVMQAIVVGISFLGGGTIIQRGGDVEGLTTAASIFLTAGVGIATGVERYSLAVATTVFAIAVLIAVSWVELRFLGKDPDDL